MTQKTWVTCAEHAHCQQEIIEDHGDRTDDQINDLIVVHHRNAGLQPDSPHEPARVDQLVERGQRLDARADSLDRRAKNLDAAQRTSEEAAIARNEALDARAAHLDKEHDGYRALLTAVNTILELLEK